MFSASAAEIDLSKLPPPASGPVDFSKEIKPLLENICLKCHGPDKPKSNFHLYRREGALKGGEHGVDIIPGDSARSPLIHFVARLVEDMEMPPEGKGDPLTKEQVGLLRAWIDQGAKWPDGLILEAPPKPGEQEKNSPASELPRAKTKSLPPPAIQKVDFIKDIQPIFAKSCYSCHGPQTQRADLRLDVKSRALKGSKSGPVILPGRSAESRLVHLVAGLEEEKIMPQKGERLTSEQIGLLRAWIDAGAPWPEEEGKVANKIEHWSFTPPQRPTVPKVKKSKRKWVRNPIDAFIAAQHEARGLVPAPEASRQVLIRRLSLDLTGLPPTPEEIEAFIADTSSNAYEKLVDKLLASPHYGERWGRHWLDLARWADTAGYEANTWRPSAWRYRDYVINAFNQDKPYDRFLREQIAGDEIVPYSDKNLIATGFLAAARLSNNEEDPLRARNDVLVDITNATASVTLGLTMKCAQCHDHKFNPITIQDYYRFQGFFVKGQVNKLLLKDPELWKAQEPAIQSTQKVLRSAKQLYSVLYGPVRSRLVEEARKKLAPEFLEALNTPADRRTDAQIELAKKAEKELEIPNEKLEKELAEEDRKFFRELDQEISTLELQLQEKEPQTWGFYSPVTSPHRVDVLSTKGFTPVPYEPEKLKETKPRVLIRGDVHRPGSELEAGWPEIFGPVPAGKMDQTPRLALVDWLTSPTNPLVSRVWVNYIWQQHFGRGVVATPDDFGLLGTPPTYPELLDWLAIELMQSGWSTKHIHRLMVLSSTYRQAAAPNSKNQQVDPENRYWWRWSPRRLEAEAIRDSVLFVSGELDLTLGGPSVRQIHSHRIAPAFTFAGLTKLPKEQEERKKPRRSIYLFQMRDNFPVMQALFDGASANESCPRRQVSTVALQPLYLLNSPFMLEQAEAFAGRVLAKAGQDELQQIQSAFILALGRSPEKAEVQAARAFLESYKGNTTSAAGGSNPSSDGNPKQPPLSLVHLCHALLNLNEFVYLP